MNDLTKRRNQSLQVVLDVLAGVGIYYVGKQIWLFIFA